MKQKNLVFAFVLGAVACSKNNNNNGYGGNPPVGVFWGFSLKSLISSLFSF
jgi:hypothetical protein